MMTPPAEAEPEAARGVAAIYVRISDDREGAGLGVARQEEDCRPLCGRRGYPQERIRVYSDNDISAFSGKTRPEYERLLGDITAGDVGLLVAWHPDRLHRSPIELERFITIVEAAGVTIETARAGVLDLTKSTGRMIARIVGAVARGESEHKSDRVRRKMKEIAEAGTLSGGGTRPYGYDDDRKTLRDAEAEVVREAARRVLNGEAIRSLCRDFEKRGVATVKGAPWTPTVLRNLLLSARISGRREHGRREAHTRSSRLAPITSTTVEWATIIRPADSDALRRLLSNPARRAAWSAGRTHLLGGGVARCGICDARLVSRPAAAWRDSEGNIVRAARPCYICAKGPGFHGCGGIRVGADELESDVIERVLIAVDDGALDRILDADTDTAQSEALHAVAALEQELNGLATAFGAGEFSRSEWSAMRVGINDRLGRAQRHYDELRGRESLHCTPRPLRSAWDKFDDPQRRATIRDLIAEVRVAPATRGRNTYDRARVRVMWRV